MEAPQMVKIKEVRDEAKDIKSFLFNHDFEREPQSGQFLMAWLPGVDEIPLAFSHISPKRPYEYAVTIARVGTATKEIHLLRRNDMFGVRGPYGNGFSFERTRKLLVVGGGIGMAPLMPVIEAVRAKRKWLDVAIGARTADGLLFVDRIRHFGLQPLLCTDDGTAGKKGLVTDHVTELLDRYKYDLVVCCGPEPMLVKLVKICNERRIKIQVSLERYMKCGVGICDSCAINGFHVCKDGPVFEGDHLAKIKDFGQFKRDATGKRIRIQ